MRQTSQAVYAVAMSHIPFTLLAYFFNAISVLIDKILLTKSVGHPLTYVFYISAASFTSLVVIPFVPLPTRWVFLLASLSTILWTTGAYFMFQALKDGLASRVIPVIGTLIPLMLLVQGLTNAAVTSNQAVAVLLLVSGLIFLTLPAWKGDLHAKELVLELLSALFFAASYLVLRQAYLEGNFLAILGWSRMILFPLLGLAIAIPFTRAIIFAHQSSEHHFKLWSKNGLLFAGAQMAGGTSELLLTYSVSLANPALVNSLQGTQYAFIFIGSLLLARKFPAIFAEKITKLSLVQKVIGIALLAGGLYLLRG